MPALVAARVVQGGGAALLTPASLALISTAFAPSERSRAIGIWAAASALTTAGGPVLGGVLTDAVGWQAIFWINPPLALIAIALLWRDVGHRAHGPSAPFDLLGAGLAAVALAALAYVLGTLGPGETPALESPARAASGLTGPDPSALNAQPGVPDLWSPVSTVWVIGLIGMMACAGFLGRQHLAAAPIMPLGVFANRTFSGLNAVTLLLYAAQAALVFAVPFELIDARGLDATTAGLVLMPWTLGVGLLSRLFGALADRYGPRPFLLIGSAGTGMAFIGFALLADQLLWLAVLVPMAIVGVSFASLAAPLTAAVMGCVSGHREGLASGINNTAARIAQLIGFATAAGLASFTDGYTLTL
ncbi:MAG: MFS transporter, partial [Pseudomonadota bacterium]